MSRRRSFRIHILVFLAPAVLIYTLFMIYPLFDSLWLSLNNKAPVGGAEFVGVQNYQTFLSQERWAKPFWNALRNNALFFVIHMLVQNPIGLLLAALWEPVSGAVGFIEPLFSRLPFSPWSSLALSGN